MKNKSEYAFTFRLATADDIPALLPLMDASIRALLKPYLSADKVKASFDVMGIDTQLIDDGTYFVIEKASTIVGCGGWSRRATLFGGNHTKGRNAALLDPENDAARIRAMYTHPEWTRRGIGKLIIELCEKAAKLEGFKRAELAATLAGEPLYKACGYIVIKEFESEANNGLKIPLLQMEKKL